MNEKQLTSMISRVLEYLADRGELDYEIEFTHPIRYTDTEVLGFSVTYQGREFIITAKEIK